MRQTGASSRAWLLAAAILALAAQANAADIPTEGVLYSTGSWGTLVCLFFLLSALFQDVLLVRIMLVLAYIFLTINVCLNFPDITQWDVNSNPNKLMLGSLLWTVITLFVQLVALVMMLWEERPVRLQGDDEMLWRCFWRRAGMVKTEFMHVLKRGKWESYKAGEVVEPEGCANPKVYLIFKGKMSIRGESGYNDAIMASGSLVNFWMCNLFGVYIGFEGDTSSQRTLVADTDVTAFSWDMDALLAMSGGAVSVALPACWRSFLLHSVSAEISLKLKGIPMTSLGEPEPDVKAWCAGQAMTIDFTAPLGPDESCKPTFMGVVKWIFGSLTIFPPRGMRHDPRPAAGNLARSRVLTATLMAKQGQELHPALSRALSSKPFGSREELLCTINSGPKPDSLAAGAKDV